ncbi:hypothetical protein BGZ60DRAFT_39136 [Tricladium varicosporioides]|nr:hypothetical protein BGZ60DRAFT_39136 [Hymenoscyphus varicosporioides]
MVLKRKRSDSEISTSSSMLSSPLSANNFMSIDSYNSNQPQISTPSLFSSRTRKRHRDNRPSEAEVHQHTLSLLFSAQQNQPPQPQNIPIAPLPSSAQSQGQQSNLHSFWALPSTARHTSPASSSSVSLINTPITSGANNCFFQPTNCEDCDASLQMDNTDAMDLDVMMDIDMNGGNCPNFACTSCGKQVCHGCAVSNLGAERKCLMCAGRKRWVGGLGWCTD